MNFSPHRIALPASTGQLCSPLRRSPKPSLTPALNLSSIFPHAFILSLDTSNRSAHAWRNHQRSYLPIGPLHWLP